MRKHLQRLGRLWVNDPIYFVATCTNSRHRLLAVEPVHAIIREVWANAEKLYGWYVGRYVVMPDHVHFFCSPGLRPGLQGRPELQKETSLSLFIGKWKEWTAKYAHRRLKLPSSLWQAEFFDHVLRSGESYEEKWEYVRQNPVRAGLASKAEDWPYQGEIHDLRFERCAV
jgi:REP-associated tyrosine transposase